MLSFLQLYKYDLQLSPFGHKIRLGRLHQTYDWPGAHQNFPRVSQICVIRAIVGRSTESARGHDEGEVEGVTERVDTSLVIAARSGDRRALDTVVAEYLPLIYNIVRRALSLDADVDDVVQDTMVRVVRGIGGLREPDRFRSWLVAITVNQIREHRRKSHTAAMRLEHNDEQPDPAAEFVDRTLTRLGESQQRREIEPAARWLGQEDRQLLSLWSLERGGHLTRADVSNALRLDAHHVAVRVSRLKNRLEAARMLVRAFAASPRCPELTRAANGWTGEQNPLWRKRFLRHVDECERCRTACADLVPAERLLMGWALLPPAVAYTMRLLSDMHSAAQPSVATAQFGHPANDAPQAAKPLGPHQRIADFVATKPVLAVAGVTAACAIGLTAVIVANHPTSTTTTALVNTTESAPPDNLMSSAPTTITTTDSPMPTTDSPTPPPRTTTKAVPPQTRSAARPQEAQSKSARLIRLLNERRRTLGLVEVKESPDLVKAAQACSRRNLEARTLSHCGHEVLFKGGEGTSPERIVDAWFSSEGHRNALTYTSSRNAGGAMVIADGQLVAAINIDY